MKRSLLYYIPATLLLVLLTYGLLFAGGEKLGTTGIGLTRSITQNEYGNSITDTLVWYYENGVTALSFAMSANDTVEVTTARLLRVVNGKPVSQGAALAGDTLTRLTALDQTTAAAIAAGIRTVDAITLAPLATQYWVIVQYASSGNGIDTLNVATYEFIKQYGK